MADMSTDSPASLMADFVQAYLPTVGVDLAEWAIYVGKLPATPDKVISFIDSSGPSGFPHLLVDWPGLQVIVRGGQGGIGYNDSWIMIQKVRDAILGMNAHPVEFPELDGVTERGHFGPMGYDDKDRHTWSANFQLLVEPTANAITHRVSI